MKKQMFLKKAGRAFEPSAKSIRCAALLLCWSAILTAQAAHEKELPDLPPVCDRIAVSEDNKAVYGVFAAGVQIYRWDGSNWVFVAPEAVLYADASRRVEVGTHFATPTGPAWEIGGSRVIEQRVDGCTPDVTAIPWLLLRTLKEEGDGVLNDVSFVQRVSTVGGIAPADPGAASGEQRRVPYTAEYFFYRSIAKLYRQENLVSDKAGVGRVQDAGLVNAWGISFGGAGPFWVTANRSGKAMLYAVTNDASGKQGLAKQSLEVTIPGDGSPTAVVNNNRPGFNGNAFLFASLDGTISGWRSALGSAAETLADRPGAMYTGLTLITNSGGTLLLAANFAEGTLDAYNTNSSLVCQFTDPGAPAGYAPFNVQVVEGVVYVMFSKAEAGRGRGFIDTFNPETGAFHRFVTGADAGGGLCQIDSPWGVALAPNSFGEHRRDLLVGNFGNGTIMSFGPDGRFHGLLKGSDHRPIVIERLWGLSFGNGGRAGSADKLFFAAGPENESHGLFGTLAPTIEHERHGR